MEGRTGDAVAVSGLCRRAVRTCPLVVTGGGAIIFLDSNGTIRGNVLLEYNEGNGGGEGTYAVNTCSVDAP